MKLNKNGWGFGAFFAFLIVFILCLLISMWGLQKFGLLDDNFHFFDGNSNTNNKKEEEKKPIVSYPSLVEKMENATKKYIEKYYENKLGVDTLYIRVSQLKSEGLLDNLKDTDGNDCSGYVAVYLDSEEKIEYDGYLKCKKYKSTGYEERKDY